MKNKILIIDDDTDFTDAITLLLQSSGYQISCAANGQEGFQKVKSESPDLILLDMMMTYKTEGAETARAIAKDAAVQNTPIILITGARKEMNFPFALRPHEVDLPVKAIIEKPVNPEILLKMIATHIAKTGKEHRKTNEELEVLVQKWQGKKGSLIMILHEIQNHYGYVPRGIAFELCRLLHIPLARVYEVITFYNYFKLDPPGKHLISVCLGTACYLKGAPQIVEELQNILHVKEGETTQDGLFRVQVVRCLGCCGLAPVIMIDDKIYGKVKKQDVMEIISRYVKDEHRETEIAQT